MKQAYSTGGKQGWLDGIRHRITRRVDRAGIQESSTGLAAANALSALGNLSFGNMAQITLDSIGDAVLVVDPSGNVIYLNKVAEDMTGWSSDAALGRAVEDVFHIIDKNTLLRSASPSERAITEGRTVALALGSVLIRKDGTGIEIEDSAAPIHNHLGRVAGAVVVFHDSKLSQSEMRRMNRLAQHDYLTSLPNRALLVDRLSHAIAMAGRHNKQLALLFVDVDNFKQINDAHGHATGDALLLEVANEIVACVRGTDTVSRHGGDEFIILLTQVEDASDPVRVAEKLLDRLSRPRILDGRDICITLSIGISVYPENGTDADTLMRNADAAMYAIKKNGRNGYKVSDAPSVTPLA